MMKSLGIWIVLVLGIFLSASGCSDDDHAIDMGPVGWAIGDRPDGTAAILHTDNGGRTWEEQGDPTLWTGMEGNDISAVDSWTAWAAVGGNQGGAILHTSDGGFNWNVQTLPEGVTDEDKGIKGLSQNVAWAVTLAGTVMRTLDGGETWVVIPHEGITMKQVNRIDAQGEDIWIADYGSGENGMIHSPDFGRTWKQETLPDPDPLPGFGPMGVSIVSSEVVWAAVRPAADLYRTLDGGDVWRLDAPDVSGPNDIDDICAPDADTVWAVQNLSGESGGSIIRVRLAGGKVISDIMDPTGNYVYEGVILHTSDGGSTWTNQPMPVKDVALWKVSFAGALR